MYMAEYLIFAKGLLTFNTVDVSSMQWARSKPLARKMNKIMRNILEPNIINGILLILLPKNCTFDRNTFSEVYLALFSASRKNFRKKSGSK